MGEEATGVSGTPIGVWASIVSGFTVWQFSFPNNLILDESFEPGAARLFISADFCILDWSSQNGYGNDNIRITKFGNVWKG